MGINWVLTLCIDNTGPQGLFYIGIPCNGLQLRNTVHGGQNIFIKKNNYLHSWKYIRILFHPGIISLQKK